VVVAAAVAAVIATAIVIINRPFRLLRLL